MNIRQLACFVAVVDEGSFTRRRERSGPAQPSLSQHIPRPRGGAERTPDRAPAARDRIDAGGLCPSSRGAGGCAGGRARSPRSSCRTRARSRRARDRDGALDGRRTASALHPRLARAVSERRHPAPRVSPPGRCSRTPSSKALRTSPSAAPVRAWEGPLAVIASGKSSWSCLRQTTRLPAAAPSASRELADREWVLYHRVHGLAGILEETCRRAGFSPRGSVRTSQAEWRCAACVGRARACARPRQHRAARDRGVGAAPQKARAIRDVARLCAERMVLDRCGRSWACSAGRGPRPRNAVTIRPKPGV